MRGYTIRFEVTPGLPPKDQDGTVDRRGGYCFISKEPIPFEYIRAEGKAGRMGAMLMAIVTEGKNGRNYHSPTDEHARIAEQAQPQWKPMGDIPEQALGFRVQLYGMDEYHKLFTPRQLVALTTFSDLIHEARQQAYQDALAAGLPDDNVPLREGGRGALAYAEAISVYLAFAVDKSADYWSSICSWHNSGEKMRNTFGRQAIPMVWDYAEGNPFSGSTGNWLASVEWIWKVIESFPANSDGHAAQQDASQLDLPAHTLSTDPPYYDAIGYADLSDFFYVWLRPALRAVYPDLFSTLLVPKAAELIASPHRHGGKEAAKRHFEDGLRQTFANIRRFVSPDYPLTVYYAFKQQEAEDFTPDPSDVEEPLTPGPSAAEALTPDPSAAEALTPDPSPIQGRGERGEKEGSLYTAAGEEEKSPSPLVGEGFRVRAVGEGFRVRAVGEGFRVRASTGWETMLTSLIEAGFTIDGTWPMRTERPTGVKALVNALASSIVLVCRPRPADAPFASRRTFLDALRRELPNALAALQSGSIAPVDLAQAAIGPGMAIYSRYSKVVEADGTPLTVRTALSLINAALDEYLAEQDGSLDADTRFAVAWFEQFGFNEGEFGQADVLARAKNTSVAGVEAAGVVVAGRGKVRLIHWKEYALTLNPSPTRGEGLQNASASARGEGLQNASASARGDAPSPVTGRGGKGGEGWDPTRDERLTVWEATHHLIDRLHRSGETGSAELLQLLPPDVAAEARQLAYRLYSICERKGWAEHARDYNALVMSWSGIGEVVARLRQEAVERINTQQRPLFKDE
ncbi:hypothetical protein VZO05_10375 [Aggregatilineales bacterium SYSU G02658]